MTTEPQTITNYPKKANWCAIGFSVLAQGGRLLFILIFCLCACSHLSTGWWLHEQSGRREASALSLVMAAMGMVVAAATATGPGRQATGGGAVGRGWSASILLKGWGSARGRKVCSFVYLQQNWIPQLCHEPNDKTGWFLGFSDLWSGSCPSLMAT